MGKATIPAGISPPVASGNQATTSPRLPGVNLGPLAIASANFQSALEYTGALIKDGGSHYFCFCEASLLSNVVRDERVRDCVGEAAAVFPDGVALTVLARLQGHRLPERIPGPSFLLAAAEYGLSRGWRHFFYGGSPGVAQRLAERLTSRYPGLLVAGTHSPPFRELTQQEQLEIKSMIDSSGAHLLWVCLGSPKQELWAAEQVGRIKVPVILPVGAAFDFHSGHRPWAPPWVRAIGMEWLFRTITGGRRTFLRNLRCVTVIAGLLFKVALRRLLRRAVL
ncbi:MAG TPA: WecB/TagA/CpsF family glycosyltransferase [Candidatus Paceibacterota bacterium]|nr:WecB/TagA/CpsF family glycosyltransferase [Verrucomicrobiota bacterium]HSA12687.1 WecB/TagA/CpsF family glycosyltransferase [Candidatus Paceibacterota bacterium]